MVMPYLLNVYGAYCVNHCRSRLSGGDRERTRGWEDSSSHGNVSVKTTKAPRTLMSCIRSYRLVGSSPIPWSVIAEALLITISMPPNRSTVFETAEATTLSSRTSPVIGSALPPASSIFAAAVWTVPGSLGSGSAVFARTAIFAPSLLASRGLPVRCLGYHRS